MSDKESDGLKMEWFERGRNSVLRKNKSGCCCIIDDSGIIISVCGSHKEWLESALGGENE